MKKPFTLLPLLLTLTALPTCCFATTIHFDEFGTAPVLNVDGLHVFGVSFHFNAVADYNGQIGTSGNAVLVSDPLLTGPTTGTLTLDFDVPTPLLQFDIALLSLDSIASAFTVTVPGSAGVVGSTGPQPTGFYSEGSFQYSGAPITHADITFFNGTDSSGGMVTAFGLDNLTYQTGSQAVPEPAAGVLLTGALLVLGVLGRRKSRGGTGS